MTAPAGPPPARLPALGWTLTQRQIDAYARATGADDAIHVDPAAAALTPLGGTIAQGMLILAVMAAFVGDRVADAASWRAGGTLDVRFRLPARPGDRLTVAAEYRGADADGRARYEIWCENQDGARVIAGDALVPASALRR